MVLRKMQRFFSGLVCLLVGMDYVSSQITPFCQSQRASCVASCVAPASAHFSCEASAVSCQCSSGTDVDSSASSFGTFPQGFQNPSISVATNTANVAGAGAFASTGVSPQSLGESNEGMVSTISSAVPTGLGAISTAGLDSVPTCAAKKLQCDQTCIGGRAVFLCDERGGSQSASCSCTPLNLGLGMIGSTQVAASSSISQSVSTADGAFAAGPATMEHISLCNTRRSLCEATCGSVPARFECRDVEGGTASSCSCGAAPLLPLDASLSSDAASLAVSSGSCQQQRLQCASTCPQPGAPGFYCQESSTGIAVSCSCVSGGDTTLGFPPVAAPAPLESKRCRAAKRHCTETCPAPGIVHFRCDDSGDAMAVSCSCSAGLAPAPSPAQIFSSCKTKRQQCQSLCPALSYVTFTCGDPANNVPSTCACAGTPTAGSVRATQAGAFAGQTRVAPAPLSRLFTPARAV
eukprot:jgi/Botrbrau1/4900/Bobra.118_1s0014.1